MIRTVNVSPRSLAMLMAMLLLGAIVAPAVVCAQAAADGAEKLLSSNATYRIRGGGYVYTGQIQPGVNEGAEEAGIVFAPLVETTDRGDALIDGDDTDASKIYTPWRWHQPGKVIEIEMTLPGESQVSRVHVQFPQDTNYRPESARLFIKDAAGKWIDLGIQWVHSERDPVEQSPDSATFELKERSCRDLKIVVGGNRRHVGITEIEVWGDGPTENDRRGLVPQTPHIQTVKPHKAVPPEGSDNLAKSAKLSFESSHALTVGTSAALIDSKRASGIRIDGQPQKHWYVTAELDLGDTYQIDAIHVWMPGGKGVSNGHLHEVKLAVSPSADQLDWDSPTGMLVNPYWPLDDAPKPYVIAANDLNVPGRRVRIEAYLSGTGGVTSILALGEIEIWGRPFDGPAPTVARLELRPVQIEGETIANLSPKWEQLRKHRIRGIWIAGDLDNPFGGTGKTKGQVLGEAGFNAVVIYTGPDRKNRNTAPELEDRIRRNVAEAHSNGMVLLAKWQYGSTHIEPYRRFRGANGLLHSRSSCPLQPEYVERHVGRWALAAAKLGADGFTFDTEMYESDGTGYPSACYCDSCFKLYLKTYSTDWERHDARIAAERRGEWIEANVATRHYAQAQRQHLIRLFDGIRARCRQVNPDYLFAYAPFLGYLSGLTHGLGTPNKPVIVWSEREYTGGPTGKTADFLKRIHNQKLPVFYVGGHMLWYQNPATLTENALEAALYTDGWWAWMGTGILTNIGLDDPIAFKAPYGRAAGFTAMQYLDAIKAMHDRLDILLEQDPEQWPKSELFPIAK
jgi:hypothetical protein